MIEDTKILPYKLKGTILDFCRQTAIMCRGIKGEGLSDGTIIPNDHVATEDTKILPYKGTILDFCRRTAIMCWGVEGGRKREREREFCEQMACMRWLDMVLIRIMHSLHSTQYNELS